MQDNVVRLEGLFSEQNYKVRKDVVDNVLTFYKTKKNTVERRIRISTEIDYIVQQEKLNYRTLIETAIKEYLKFKY